MHDNVQFIYWQTISVVTKMSEDLANRWTSFVHGDRLTAFSPAKCMAPSQLIVQLRATDWIHLFILE